MRLARLVITVLAASTLIVAELPKAWNDGRLDRGEPRLVAARITGQAGMDWQGPFVGLAVVSAEFLRDEPGRARLDGSTLPANDSSCS